MISMIVLGHGHFASGIQYALQQIIGEQENTIFIDFPESKSPAQLKQEILTALEQLNHQHGVLFCCDKPKGILLKAKYKVPYMHNKYKLPDHMNNLPYLLFCNKVVQM